MGMIRKLVIALIFSTASTCLHSETVNIFALELHGLHEKDNTGQYDKALLSILTSPISATLDVLPPARAHKTFESCNNCCISPANNNPEYYSFDVNTVFTDPLDIAKLYIFTSPGMPTVNNLKDLKGQSVGIRLGIPYGKKIGRLLYGDLEINVEKVHSSISNIQKLAKGRISAFLDYTPDIYASFDLVDIDVYPYDKEHPINIHEDSLACKGVSKNFVKIFNTRLRKYKQKNKINSP